MLTGVHRIIKNDDVAALYFAIGEKMAPEAITAEVEFVDQQVVADEQSVLHGLGRNLESLHDECDDEYCDDDGSK
jgi:hypothetical protein